MAGLVVGFELGGRDIGLASMEDEDNVRHIVEALREWHDRSL